MRNKSSSSDSLPLWATSAASLALLLSSCADDPTAIRIKLVANPALNTEQQVLSVIEPLQIILDSERGFDDSSDDGLFAGNVDHDDQLELVYQQSVRGLSSFPLLRLRPSSQLSEPFRVHARGLAGGQVAAIGEAQTAEFVLGESRELTVPLDLRAQYRAPRVESTLPDQGQEDVPAALGAVFVVFSKAVALDSVKDNLQLIYEATGDPVAIPWELSHATVAELGLPAQRTIATLDLGDCSLSPGAYRLVASSKITDTAGVPLDQQPQSAELDGFTATFELPGTASDEACGQQQAGCARDEDCDTAEPPRFVCARTGAVGRCVPTPPTCNDAITCPAGYRCDEADGHVRCIKEGCTKHADCDPSDTPRYFCALEGPLQGECLPLPRCEEMVTCPNDYTCVAGDIGDPLRCVPEPEPKCTTEPDSCELYAFCAEETLRCTPCVKYPSRGCEVACEKEEDPICPKGTQCHVAEGVCLDL